MVVMGPNGSGKSTLLRLVSTELPSRPGSLILFDGAGGRSSREVRRKIGIVQDTSVHVDDLTGMENGLLFAELYGFPRDESAGALEALFKSLGLDDALHVPTREYSYGMKKKLLIAQALVHEPEMLILDEPALGLDPPSREALLRILEERSEQGVCTLVATNGLLRRYVLTGAHPGGLLLQRLFATAALDLIELAPSVLVIAAARGSSASQLAIVGPAMVLGLLAANALGALTAALSKSVAEGALFSAVAALLLLHWAGTFRTPVSGTWQAMLEVWNPFRPLHESLLAAAGAGGPNLDPALLAAPIGATLAVLLLIAAAGRYLIGLGGR